MELTDSQVYEIQSQMAKAQGITPDVYQRLLAERIAMVDRSRLAAIGVLL